MHFNQWNRDKYENSALFLHNNYIQALGIISSETGALKEALNSLGATEADVDSWREEEGEYLKTLKEGKPEWDPHALAYVDLLGKLAAYE